MQVRTIKNNVGFSMLELIFSIGMMMIMGSAMTSLIINSQKQNTALQQKLTAIEYEQLLTRLLADSTSCNCMFSGLPWPTTITADSKINLTSLKMGCSNTVSFLSKDQILSSSGSLKIENIELKNLQNLDVTPTKVSADIVINFNSNSDIGVLKPITLSSQNFNLTGTNITSCLGMSGSDKICTNLGGIWNGSICNLPSSPESTCLSIGGLYTSGKCSLTPSKQASCENIGGTWSGTNCKLNVTAGVNSSETCASTYGTGWTWTGSACTPPTTPMGKILAVGILEGPISPSCHGMYSLSGMSNCNTNEERHGVSKIPEGYSECPLNPRAYCSYDTTSTIQQRTCYKKGGSKYYPYRCSGSSAPTPEGAMG